jgi:chromosome segregation ATPase
MTNFLTALVLLQCAVITPAGRVAAPPAIAKVVTMLENLITMMESEGTEDEKKFNHFDQYCESEKSASNAKISELNTKIEDTNAALQDLLAQKSELDATVGKLKGEIDKETTQVNAATDKRTSEHDAFAKEQIDFDNAVSACNKAVKLLGAHYGDAPKEAKKPAWLSLANTYLTTISTSIEGLGSSGKHKKLVAAIKSKKGAIALLHMHKDSGKGPYEQYEDSREESGNIVDQVQVLAQTFAEDKQSAIEEENRMQKTFDGLIAKKNAILSTLTGERDTQQATLNGVNQNIAESQSALKMAQDTLGDTQTYLSSIIKQHTEATQMYDTRVKDRKDETEAVNNALDVLSGVSFIQKQQSTKARGISIYKHRKDPPFCSGCAKVAAMLRQKARLFHSAVLSAAAATSMGSDAIDGVIDNLKKLIQRIDEEQKTEKEHKDWCEEETSLSNKKVTDHSTIVDEQKGVIADLGEVIKEKEIDLDSNEEDIQDEEDNFEAQTEIRKEEKEEFEEDLQDHLDAIQALNEAIEILANFYSKKKAASAAMLQVRPSKVTFLQRGMHTGRPSGGKVVDMMSDTRQEFEQAKDHLQKEEEEAVKDFQEVKQRHLKVSSDLAAQRNQLTVEKQTAEMQLDSAKHDMQTNQNEVDAANNYLKQLGLSCYPLIMHFDERTKLRKEEKDAIKDAIKVLRSA